MNKPLKKRSLIFYREVLRESIAKFLDEDLPAHSAALAFYTIFSLPSMLFTPTLQKLEGFRAKASKVKL